MTDVCIVGGAGHVGAPLAIVLAEKGLSTCVYDLDRKALRALMTGCMPFRDEGAEELLRTALAAGRLSFTSDVSSAAGAPIVIVTIGTPIDEFHNPMLGVVTKCIDSLLPHLSDGQALILRSTVFPGVTEYVHHYLRSNGKDLHVAFCPERVVQGRAVIELQSLPQIVSGATPQAEQVAAALFARIAPKIIRMRPREAELAKLISNAYRYIQFAATNQFYMMAEAEGIDYGRVLTGLREDYPRAHELPDPGFAAGPCLFKDTLQLAAFSNSVFGVGQAALQANEGLPAFVVARLRAQYPLSEMTVGILGMAFKPGSDDARSSLSYKLKKLLKYACKDVLTTDPFVAGDTDLFPVDEVINRSDVLIVATPHSVYRDLDLRGKPLVDFGRLRGKLR